MTPKKPNLAVDAPPVELIRFPVLGSPKFDGIRITNWPEQPLTRSLKPIPNRFIRSTIIAAKLPAVFDGELIVGPPTAADVFSQSTSGVMSHDGEPAFGFYVFDYVPTDNALFRDRALRLAERTHAVAAFNPWFKVVTQTMILDAEQLAEYEESNLLLGYEGTMLCNLDAQYKHGRSTAIEQGKMKRKPFVDAEALVIGCFEQMQNTNAQAVNELGNMKRSSAQAGMVGKGTLGGFVCRTPEGVEFNLGTGVGLTAELRQQLWNIRDTLPGRIAKYKTQLIGTKDKPRIPVWLGFRDPRDMG